MVYFRVCYQCWYILLSRMLFFPTERSTSLTSPKQQPGFQPISGRLVAKNVILHVIRQTY